MPSNLIENGIVTEYTYYDNFYVLPGLQIH